MCRNQYVTDKLQFITHEGFTVLQGRHGVPTVLQQDGKPSQRSLKIQVKKDSENKFVAYCM